MQKVVEKVNKLITRVDPQAGTRVRERRLDLGIRQADLAKELGISPSYLNLIEHNRRRIAGNLLAQVGRVLGVDPTLLTQGASRAVLDQLHAAAAAAGEAPETDRVHELAARYPGWAQLIGTQHERITSLEARIAELTDRMAHDPELATSMHAVISAVTSIRSAASILTSGETLDADWTSRFHKNINDDAVRLSESSEALLHYLDAPKDADVPVSPMDEVTQVFEHHDFHFPSLERRGGSVDGLVEAAGLRPPADGMLREALENYHRLAQAMPLARLEDAIGQDGFDPDKLSQKFHVSFQDVLVRSSFLGASRALPQTGLVICDGSGFITFQKPIDGVALARGGIACPLWPLFTAMGQPGRPIVETVSMPGQQGDRFDCYAVTSQNGGGLKVPPAVRSVMLIVPAHGSDATSALALGPTCRICPHDACHARREPSALKLAV